MTSAEIEGLATWLSAAAKNSRSMYGPAAGGLYADAAAALRALSAERDRENRLLRAGWTLGFGLITYQWRLKEQAATHIDRAEAARLAEEKQNA